MVLNAEPIKLNIIIMITNIILYYINNIYNNIRLSPSLFKTFIYLSIFILHQVHDGSDDKMIKTYFLH